MKTKTEARDDFWCGNEFVANFQHRWWEVQRSGHYRLRVVNSRRTTASHGLTGGLGRLVRKYTAVVGAVFGLSLLSSGPGHGATFRWASSTQRIYVEGGGAATLTDIKTALPNAPLDLVDAAGRVWLLRANLLIEDGSVLVLHGSSRGGDVNEFRLRSGNSGSNDFVSVTADWGGIDINSTRIISWDPAVNGPDTEFATFGRAYIRVRSELGPDGVTPLESRMDIVDSDISCLGYDAAESYGLSWKVNGTHPDPRESIFDHVNVYGDIVGNRIHDNFWGVYAFGHEGGRWRNNEVDHNAGYGFDPHDDSDNLLIEGNDVHHNGHLGRGPHGIIASKNCDRLVIRNNRSWANAEHGIMLHRHCDDCLIENNESFGNGGSGIALFDVDRTMVRNNLVRSNSNAGIRLSVGCADNVIVNNEVAYSGEEGLLMLPGTDPAEPDPVDPTVTNRNRRHTVASNLVHHCQSEGLQLTDSGDCLVVGNVFGANAPSMSFVNVSQVVFRSNSIPAGLTVELSGSPAVPTAMLFREQPVVKLVLGDAYCAATFEDDAGAIFDFDQAQVATGVDVQVRSSRSPPRRSAVGQRLSPVTSGCA